MRLPTPQPDGQQQDKFAKLADAATVQNPSDSALVTVSKLVCERLPIL